MGSRILLGPGHQSSSSTRGGKTEGWREGEKEGREGERNESQRVSFSCTNKHRSKLGPFVLLGWGRRMTEEKTYICTVLWTRMIPPVTKTSDQQEEREDGPQRYVALASWLPRLGQCYLEGSLRTWISWIVTRSIGGPSHLWWGEAQWRQDLQKSWNL